MPNALVITKGRTKIITVNVGMDVSGNTLTSEIRAAQDPASALLATWTVALTNTGTDGLLTLTLDNSQTENITAKTGFMDLKRVSNGEPLDVFAEPLRVEFQNRVTV